MIEIKTILLPTDFSEPSLTATRYAIEMARRFGATLHLLHVIEDPEIYVPAFESYPLPPREDFERYAQERLESWISPEDAEGCQIQRQWVHGIPLPEILGKAGELDADLIVIGTHGRTFLAHAFLGSVAEKLVRKSPCPVLTVRPGEHQFVHP